jgi:hypothetical protein
MVSILAAILMAPTHANVTVHTDCRSALQAINHDRDRDWQADCAPYSASYHLPQRRRVVMACRPVLNLIRRAIQDRRGTVTLVWIRAHTDGRDLHSRMNDIADREANKARMEATQRWHRIAGYERLVMRVAKTETIGPYRKQVQRHLIRSTLTLLAQMPHQGQLARTHGSQLLEFCGVAQRANDPDLVRFVTELIAEWLPTEAVRTSQHADRGRGPTCKLCGNEKETVRHALCDCPHQLPRLARKLACERSADLLTEPPHCTTAPTMARPNQNGPGIYIPAFFDPTGKTIMELCPAVSSKVQHELREFDPLAGLVGIFPEGLDEALCWVNTGKDTWSKLSLRDTRARMERLRASLLLGGLQVWTARCRALDTWWQTQAPTKFVAAEAKARLAREAKIKSTAATAAGAKDAIAAAKRMADESSKRLRPAATRVRGALAAVILTIPQPPSAPPKKMSRMEQELQSYLTAGLREGSSTNLAGFRVNIRPRDFGQLITDDAQQAELLEEVERQDSIHNARKWITLPWY